MIFISVLYIIKKGVFMFERNDKTFGERFFGTSQTTLQFFIYCLVSFSFYYYAWIYNFVKEIKPSLPQNSKLEPRIALVIAGLMGWSLNLQLVFLERLFSNILVAASNIDTYQVIFSLINLLSLIAFILCIYVSIQGRKVVLKMLEENNLKAPINIVLTVIFQMLYLYYCIKNAEERHNKFNK